MAVKVLRVNGTGRQSTILSFKFSVCVLRLRNAALTCLSESGFPKNDSANVLARAGRRRIFQRSHRAHAGSFNEDSIRIKGLQFEIRFSDVCKYEDYCLLGCITVCFC